MENVENHLHSIPPGLQPGLSQLLADSHAVLLSAVRKNRGGKDTAQSLPIDLVPDIIT